MSTRLLFFVALAMLLTAAYFYASNDAALSSIVLKPSDIDYQASNIKALQTKDDGAVNYRLTAKSVTHYQTARSAMLDGANMVWQNDPSRQVTLTAQQALLNESRQIITFKNKITIQSRPSNVATAMPAQQMQLDTSNLVGNLLSKQVYTNDPVTVTQPIFNADGTSSGNNSFIANRMQADLATGDYNFERVAMTFMPAQ